MALQGTLEEFGAIELLQLPYNGKRTCQVTLTSQHGKATLYYDRGQLVHAQFQQLKGEAVVEEVMRWRTGIFVLTPNVMPPDHTINKDLHNLLLLTVKKQDEDKYREKEIGQRQEVYPASKLADELEAYRSSNNFAVHLAIIDKTGEVVAQANDPKKTQAQIDEVQQLVSKVAVMYPRKGLKRTFYEDELGIVTATRLTDSWTLLAVSERDRPLGAVWLALNKLAELINQRAGVIC